MNRIELGIFGFQVEFVPYGFDPPLDYLFLLAHCGRGAGKSFGGALRMLFYMCRYNNSAGMITTPIYDVFTSATLPAIATVFEMAGFREGKEWEYLKNEKHFIFNPTNSHAFARTTEEPDKLAGPDLCWAWMDEARWSPREAFAKIVGTLRKDGYPRQFWATTTPAGRGHWLFEFWYPDEYYLENPEMIPSAGTIGIFKSFKGTTADNKTSRSMLSIMERVYGKDSTMLKQEGYGEFINQEDMVYDQRSRDKHMINTAQWPTKPKYIACGVDFGFDSPSAFLVGGVDEDKHTYLLDEVYKRRLYPEAIGQIAVELAKKHKITHFVCDSASPDKIGAINQALHKAGQSNCYAMKAHKKIGSLDDLTSGIGRCYAILTSLDSQGRQAFYVAPHLINFRREIENWTRETPKDGTNPKEKPRNMPDHLLDSWRYLMAFFYHQGYLGERGQIKPLLIRTRIA